MGFALGRVVATAAVDKRMKADKGFFDFVQDSIRRYISRDWGSMCDEDKALNDDALVNDQRVLAVYIYPKDETEIWIIMEWDRSVTTILFPEEY